MAKRRAQIKRSGSVRAGANALKWAQARMARKQPPANNVGLMYMLAGGSDASNMDPWRTKPAQGHD